MFDHKKGSPSDRFGDRDIGPGIPPTGAPKTYLSRFGSPLGAKGRIGGVLRIRSVRSVPASYPIRKTVAGGTVERMSVSVEESFSKDQPLVW